MKNYIKRNSHINSKLQMIYISYNNYNHPVAKTYTSLHYTCRYFTSSSHLNLTNYTSLHFTTLSCNLITFKFPTAALPLSPLHCTFSRISPHFYSFHFTPFIIAILTLYLKILGLQWKVLNGSAGSLFQYLMVLFTINTSWYPFFASCP